MLFHLKARGTTVRTECLAGLTTFATMAYIIVVNPMVLSSAGMDFGAVMVATILTAAASTLLMGLYANYPFAQAPGMGLNAYFTYGVVLTMGLSWQTALGSCAIAGFFFLLFNLFGWRQKLMEAIPPSLRLAVTAGLGCFLAVIGLKNVGVIVSNTDTVVALGSVTTPEALLTGVGLVVIAALTAKKVRGAILLGIMCTWLLGLACGLTAWEGLVAMPPSLAPTFLQLDIAAAVRPEATAVLVAFLFIAIFDTAGTLIGLAEQGELLDSAGKLPHAKKALVSDAAGTMLGAVLGTSPVTTYLESASGIEAGGRTGLTSVVVAMLLLLSLFFSPLVGAIPLFATSPVLLIVGAMMLRAIRKVPWEDATEAIPAFIIFITIPLTFSIATGIALGFITYPVIKTLSGRYRETTLLGWAIAVGFAAKFAVLG